MSRHPLDLVQIGTYKGWPIMWPEDVPLPSRKAQRVILILVESAYNLGFNVAAEAKP